MHYLHDLTGYRYTLDVYVQYGQKDADAGDRFGS
jgi:hypothetical protein